MDQSTWPSDTYDDSYGTADARQEKEHTVQKHPPKEASTGKSAADAFEGVNRGDKCAYAAVVRSQCGPCNDPLTVKSISNTWCDILRDKGVSLECLCALARHVDIRYPWDPSYNTARLVYNKRINVFPQAIVYAHSAEDVRRALAWTADHNVPFSVRSGGHSVEGYSTTTGVVIDLSRLDGLEVSPDAREVAIQAGSLIGPTYLRLQNGDQGTPETRGHGPGGLIVPMGTCANVGVAGLVQGGGVGFLMRRWGFTCDSLVAAEVVLADGSIVRADAHGPHADLFWAMRGAGGGNFGIATRFVFGTQRLSTVLLFEITFAWDDAVVVADAWQRWAPYAPTRLTGQISFTPPTPLVAASTTTATTSPHEKERRPDVQPGKVVVTGEWVPDFVQDDDDSTKDEAHAQSLAKARHGLEQALKAFRTAVADAARGQNTARPRPLGGGPRAWTSSVLDAARHFTDNNKRPPMSKIKTGFANDLLSPRALRRLVAAMSEPPAIKRRCATAPTLTSVTFQAMGGAIAAVPVNATSFFHRRNTLFWVEYSGHWTAPEDAAAVAAWVTRTWGALERDLSGYAYVNFPDLALPDWQSAFWGPHLERLSLIKARYDPTGRFCMPQSVPLPPRFALSDA
ncbi:FAD linked glycolate oxidase [Pandoravirus macleodensis]|uniref:FAD linked glycolate oxidase n=1 Tax=Pandoravirus macleodensis TaxID=2107707 RepID=A0A2U7UHI6_9VIRU|nr:FAD linked glycolate oxidase [Pandoravirus macleodensis]AVK77421.1 FAD linked glycolate oxidase [Pandoravirus macleodensis]